MVNRIIGDDPSKGDMHNRHETKILTFLMSANLGSQTSGHSSSSVARMKDYDMWPIYILGVTWTLPQQPAAAYITLILKSLGFGTFTTNLLTIPAYVLFVLQPVFWTWISERINNRFLIVLACQFWMLPMIIALEILPGGTTYNWSRYVLTFLLVGYPYVHAILGKTYPSTNISKI